MDLPDFMTRLPDGEIRVSGHRIGLYHLVQRYNEGESAEMISSRYPTLALSLVHKVLAFYLENQSEIDSYVETCSAAIEQQQREAGTLDQDALRRRLMKQQSLASEAQTG